MRPSILKSAMHGLIDAQVPFFLWGAPGIGKSAIVAQVAADRDIQLRDVRIALMDPVDMRGFPVPDTKKGQMKWLPANWLPTEGEGILFLDELNSAPPAMQASAYQLFHGRALGDYRLPDGWVVCAAGNREADRAVVHKMPSALANRMAHLDVECHMQDWTNWAMANGVHEHVVSFVQFKPDLLHKFDPTQNERAFPSPRSWEMASRVLSSNFSEDSLAPTLAGIIGQGTSVEFMAYVESAGSLPSFTSICEDPANAALPTSISLRYSLTTMLAKYAEKRVMRSVMLYIKRLPNDFQVLFARQMLARDKSLSEVREFAEWAVAAIPTPSSHTLTATTR